MPPMIREQPIRPGLGRDELLRALAAVFVPDPRILCAFLFGSRAWGQAGPLSDIDVAYHPTAPLNLDEEAALLDRLASAVGTHELDLVRLTALPLRTRVEVLQSGILIHARRPEVPFDLLERARHEYFDFLPIEREYEREFLANLRSGGGRLK